MTGVQEKFNDATDCKIKYVEQITLKDRRIREDAERQGCIDRARTKWNTAKYKGKGYVTVQRPVQRLILLLPIDEQ